MRYKLDKKTREKISDSMKKISASKEWRDNLKKKSLIRKSKLGFVKKLT